MGFSSRAKRSAAVSETFAILKYFAAAPFLVLGDGGGLQHSRAELAHGQPVYESAVSMLHQAAEAELPHAVRTLIQKPSLPPSGDAHDYYSLSPYWWPDPAHPQGPYIWKDGRVNPERDAYDFPKLAALERAANTLAPAYAFTGDERYAAKAAAWLRAWFVDPKTRMNPNAVYAQYRKGHGDDQQASIIEASHLRGIPDDASLLVGSRAWSAADQAAVRQWFGAFARWLADDPRAAKERAAPNNHGSWDTAQIVEYSLFAGDRARARRFLAGVPARIRHQIEPDGREPFELRRTKALHYSNLNNEALMTLVRLSQKCGADLLADPDVARRLHASLDFVAPYALGEKRWPYSQISQLDAADYAELADTYWQAALAFHDPAYLRIVFRLPGAPAPPPSLVLLSPWPSSLPKR